MNYIRLIDNMTDVLKEQLIKLGYMDKNVRLYYPLESLLDLTESKVDKKTLKADLRTYFKEQEDTYGEIKITSVEDRFCINIPAKGVSYINEQLDDKEFLKAFIEKIMAHPKSIEDLLEVFEAYSNQVVCKKEDHGEFDYVVYFEDGNPDAYRYCIKFEGMHITYHRFTISDYERFEFE